MNKDVHASFETITLKKSQCKLITMNKKINKPFRFQLLQASIHQEVFCSRVWKQKPEPVCHSMKIWLFYNDYIKLTNFLPRSEALHEKLLQVTKDLHWKPN